MCQGVPFWLLVGGLQDSTVMGDPIWSAQASIRSLLATGIVRGGRRFRLRTNTAGVVGWIEGSDRPAGFVRRCDCGGGRC